VVVQQAGVKLNTYYADFHIHIGRALGKPVKMAASPNLTLERVLHHARVLKGLDIITVIDGVCTNVLHEVRAMVKENQLVPVVGGGLMDERGLLIMLGSEVEVAGPRGGAAHFGCWFGTIEAAADFGAWLSTVQKNVSLSSQRARTDASTLAREVHQRDGIFIVHHAFTPHKGLYGNCVDMMDDMVDRQAVDALELGLSADTMMADCIEELYDISFISNSDAHSLPKIAREYNSLALVTPSFAEVQQALQRRNGRRLTGNYGMLPTLGKYHRTYCLTCQQHWDPAADACQCGSRKSVVGVYDRLIQFRDFEVPRSPAHRPPYTHQIPLEFIPGLGPKLRERLLQTFGSEMVILQEASVASLTEVVGERLAETIDAARCGRLAIIDGGGGIYGRVQEVDKRV